MVRPSFYKDRVKRVAKECRQAGVRLDKRAQIALVIYETLGLKEPLLKRNID